MSRKSGLGKGLSALIPTDLDNEPGQVTASAPAPAQAPAAEPAPAAAAPPDSGLVDIPIGEIVPNPHQPRRHFDEESLEGLAASIAGVGLLQPVLVQRLDDGSFALIAGERRWRASRLAGLTHIPAIIRKEAPGEKALLEEALVENLHRDDLNALEEAAAYQQLIEDFGLTQDQVAMRVGKSRAAISNTLRLFLLPPDIQAMIVDGRLSAGHGRALLSVDDDHRRAELAETAATEQWSVRATEQAAKGAPDDDDVTATDDVELDEADDEVSTSGSTVSDTKLREPGLLELEQLLSDHLETRVQVTMGKGTGKVMIQFADLADLERIYRKMAM